MPDVTPQELKEAVDATMTAFEQFKETNDLRIKQLEKRGAADPVTTDQLQKIEATLAAQEGVNQKLTQAELREKKLRDEMEELRQQLERVEARNQRPGTGARSPQEIRDRADRWARAALNAFTLGTPNLSADEQRILQDIVKENRALSVTDDTTGGYLAPVEYVREIIKAVTLVSPWRSLVRVRTTASKAIDLPKRTGQFSATRVTENGTRSERTGLQYGMVEITAPECYALIDISQQNLEDSAFNLEAEISGEAAEQFAVLEGAEITSGTGVGQAEGLLTNGDIGINNSGTAATIADGTGQANGLLSLKYAIKSAYARNARWAMNRTTMGSVRKLKDGQNNYIWMPGIQNGQPNTIDGDPYVEVPDMPSEGANLFPILYGDFQRAYTLLDRVSMSMLRDPYTQATAGNIRLIFRRRFGGAVVLAEAVRKLKCST